MNEGHKTVPSGLKNEGFGTLLVVIALIASFAAGVGCLFLYWTGGGNMRLGGTLALFFGCLGFALVVWSHQLMEYREVVEPREPLPSPQPERESSEQTFVAGAAEIQRRSLLKWMLAGGGALMAAMFISLMRALGRSPEASLSETFWKRGQRLMTIDGKPLTLASLQPGTSVIVFPENSIGAERAQTVLIRVQQQLIDLPRSRANWAPSGYVAYSRVCTHAGCSVGIFEPETNLLLCPCHQSTFDVLRAATPTGGPADRPLPQLPLYADPDGTLRAGGHFSDQPGPGFWGM